MKSAVARLVLGIALVGGVSSAALAAEESAKALPTLLIKGEVVSLDSSDSAAALLKVKDRYGFETPIYLESATKIMQGEAVVPATSLSAGTPVEVEYNFDVNTAKRHAVSVKVTPAVPAAATPAPVTPAVPAAATPAPVTPAAPAAAAPAEPAVPVLTPAPAAPAASSAAPEAPAQPAAKKAPATTQ